IAFAPPLRLWWRPFFLCIILAVAIICATPVPAGLLHAPPQSVRLLDRNGTPLREILSLGQSYSQVTTADEIPQQLLHATLAAEDKRFFEHPGVDPLATARAIGQLVWSGRVQSGASTITQQLIKLSQEKPRPRTLTTKLLETLEAVRLESVWTKDLILVEYMNRLHYGNLRIGPVAAARYYFAKPLTDLSAAESAFLAALPQAPGRMNPHLRFLPAKARQIRILGLMRDSGWLSEDEYQRATVEDLRLVKPGPLFEAPHFTDLILRDAARDGDPLPSGPIRTTLDLPLNQLVQTRLRQRLASLRERNVHNGAVVIIDNRTGGILAMVGSENYFSPNAGQVNGATAPRSPGSSLKPFVYLLAMEKGQTPATVAEDLPVEYPTPTGVFAPVNYNRRTYGPIRYRLALGNSLNISAVNALDHAGGAQPLIDRLQKLGVTTLTKPASHYGLGISIGNAEMRLLELTNAYASLARMGRYKPWRAWYAQDELPDTSAGTPVHDPLCTWQIADMLTDNDARALTFGRDSYLRLPFPVAVKTGTSTDWRDNWAVGYTPEFTVGIWIGNFSNLPMRDVSGVTGAAPLFREIFLHLHKRYGTSWYERPAEMVQLPIHPILGKVVPPEHPQAVMEYFRPGHIPENASPSDFDAQDRVLLPPSYKEWVDSQQNWLGDKVAVDPARHESLTIVAPVSGATYYLDPDLPDSSRRLLLRAKGSGDRTWSSSTLRTYTGENGQPYATLAPGRHQLVLSDPTTGEELKTWITVKQL
ncbi:MAG: penicillin-binding protein 1C, partial [Candidatus Methylacidiphilales bacterium]